MAKRSLLTEKSFRRTSFNQKPLPQSQVPSSEVIEANPEPTPEQKPGTPEPSTTTRKRCSRSRSRSKGSKDFKGKFKSRFLYLSPSLRATTLHRAIPRPVRHHHLHPFLLPFPLISLSLLIPEYSYPKNFYLPDLRCSIQAPRHPLPCYPLWMRSNGALFDRIA